MRKSRDKTDMGDDFVRVSKDDLATEKAQCQDVENNGDDTVAAEATQKACHGISSTR